MNHKTLDLRSIKEKFTKKTAVLILFVIGVIGILLIFLSSFISPSDNTTKENTTGNEYAAAYIDKNEKRLEDIIGKINGVGRVDVLITVESGVENIYETDTKNSDKRVENQGQDSQTQTDTDNESSHVIIDGKSGGQEALLTKQLEPQIKGVIIVCDGGNSAEVKENIIHSVSTALGLPTNRISVNKMQAK